jgi:hypothetical protein
MIKGKFSAVYDNKSYTDDEGKQRYRFVVSSNAIDRVGDSINVKNIDLTEYEKNPIVLYNHNRDIIIGNSIIKRVGDLLYGDVWFDEIHEISKKTKQQVDAGTLKTASIGLEVYETKFRELSAQERFDNKRTWINEVRIIDKSLMYEWSVVPMPANVEAELQRAKEKGYDVENMIKSFENENTEINTNKEIVMEQTIEKAGAKLSKTNKEALEQAKDLIIKVLGTTEDEDEMKTFEIENQITKLENEVKDLADKLVNLI